MALMLAYIGLEVSDERAFADFAVNGLGLMPCPPAAVQLYRTDARNWRIAVHSGELNDIAYAGFECAGAADLDALAEQLASDSIPVNRLADAELAARGVDSGFWTDDPDGLRLEFVTGSGDAAEPFSSPLVSEFVTDDQGLGHIVMGVSDLSISEAFYAKIGFSVSDYITMPMGPATLRVAFLHCGPRHHSVAIAVMPPGKRLNHFMLEAGTVDDVIQGHRRAVSQGRMPGEIGRHPNDGMLSFYVPSPAGFDVELGFGGVRIENEWSVAEYDRMSIWGHERARS